MFRILVAAIALSLCAISALAQVVPFPPVFQARAVATNGTTIHARVAGQGRRWCCSTATARPATCGRLSPPISCATTPLPEVQLHSRFSHRVAALREQKIEAK